MSARQIKKLQQLISQHDAADDDGEDAECGAEEATMRTRGSKAKKKKKNTVFNDDEQSPPLPSGSLITTVPETPKTTKVVTSSTNATEKQKGGGANSGSAPPATSANDPVKEQVKQQKKADQKERRRAKDLEDDALLDEMSRQQQQEPQGSTGRTSSDDASRGLPLTEESVMLLLEQCDSSRLDPRNEKIRKLGIGAVESKNSGTTRERVNPHMRGSAKLPTFRASPFATADKYSWPPFAPLLSLQVLPSARSSAKPLSVTATVYFVDGSGLENVKADARFDRCVRAFADVRTMATECLAYAPYHLPTLLQLHTAFLVLGDVAQAQVMLEYALFTVGVLLSRFPLSQPSTLRQLPYSDPRNQQVYLCLSRGVHHALKMGCAETAMGLCKLLLSLDPTDPKCVLLLLDYCALRGKEWSFLVACWPVMSRRLPGFAFHGALAKFLLEQESSTCPGSGLEPSPSAFEMLVQATLLHPRAAALLCEKAELKLPSGSNIVAMADVAPSSPAADRIAKLFADRSFDMWKSREVQRFAVAAFAQACSTDVTSSSSSPPMVDELHRARDGIPSSHMTQRYVGASSEDVLGETPTRIPAELLANFQRDDMAALQQEEDAQMMQHVQVSQYDADMFSRMEAAFGAVAGTFEERQEVYRQRLAHYEHLVGQEYNPLALFLRTLLPGAASVTEMAIQRALQDAGVADPVTNRREQQWQNDVAFWQRQDEQHEADRRDSDDDDASDVG